MFVRYEEATIVQGNVRSCIPKPDEHLNLHLRVSHISSVCLFGNLKKTRSVLLVQMTNGVTYRVRFETNDLAKAEVERLAALMSQATAEI
jgi:hypothetical protein